MLRGGGGGGSVLLLHRSKTDCADRASKIGLTLLLLLLIELKL